MILRKKMMKPKYAPLPRYKTNDAKYFCNLKVVKEGLFEVKNIVLEVFNSVKKTNQAVINEDFSATILKKDLIDLNGKLDKIINCTTYGICLTNEEKFVEIKSLMCDLMDCSIHLFHPKSAFNLIYESLNTIANRVGKLDKKLLQNVDNGDTFYNVYADLNSQQRVELKQNTMEFRGFLKKYIELNKLAVKAFEVNNFKEVEKPMQDFAKLCNQFYEKFDTIDFIWEGKFSKFLCTEGIDAKSFLKLCNECNKENLKRVNFIKDYKVSIPYVLGEDKEFSEFGGPEKLLLDIYNGRHF